MSEANEQTALFEWAECAKCKYPEIRLLFHIPNGGSRNKIEAANLKRQGVKSGVPDLFLPAPKGIYAGLFIEMKYGKNKPSEKQKEWLEDLEQQGYAVTVCYSWERAAAVIVKYLEQEG